MTYAEFFAQLIPGSPSPYSYQLRVAEALFAGKNLILRAPTGAGKTWATVAPFLFARAIQQPFADRLLYALPLRTLASSLHATVHAIAPSARLQIGGESGDPFFQSDIVFTTIDQLLSNYLLHPVSLSPRLDNINAGALPGALIILDEFHLFDPQRAMGTSIEMLSTLRSFSQFVIMTATLSTPLVQWLAQTLNAEIVSLSADEQALLPAQINRVRSWSWVDTPLTAEAVLANDTNQRIIALTNTVKAAQALYQSLKSRIDSTRPLLLLHSRFLPADRRRTEAQLSNLFGPEAVPNNAILITTQVVEAGIDISAEQLHTEIAPLSALMQRAGRVARYPHRNRGAVFVHPASSPFPYQLTETESSAISALVSSSIPEETWIDLHLGSAEAARINTLYGNLVPRRNMVRAAQDSPDRSCLRDLVRDINSVNVLISDNPDARPFNNGAWPQSLSVSADSLSFLRKYFLNPAPELPWIAQKLSVPDEGPMFWEPVSDYPTARTQWLILLHPQVAHYSPELGLMLDEPGPSFPIQTAPRAPRLAYSYTREYWADHTRRVMEQAVTHQPDYQIAARRFDPIADLEALVQLACAGHDIGKLTTQWQSVALAWQSQKDPATTSSHPLAHTSWQPGDPPIRFPPHAVPGAYIFAPTALSLIPSPIDEDEPSPAWAVITAIARHHAPRANDLQAFQITPTAISYGSESLSCPLLPAPLNTPDQLLTFSEHLITFQLYPVKLLMLYLVLVRRLRLADQAATAASSQ